MKVLLKSRIVDDFDKTLENVKECEQDVSERKIYVTYDNETSESYSMLQYMADVIE